MSTTSSSSSQDSISAIESNTANVDSSHAISHTDQTKRNKLINFQQEDSSSSGAFYISDEGENHEEDVNDYRTNKDLTADEQAFYADVCSLSPEQLQDYPKRPTTLSINRTSDESATTSVSELPNYGYEIHEIHLLKPTELVPIGFKLSKKADSLQYTMTAIIDGSQADKAGLKVNDWLLQIEDKDIRLTDLHDVLKDIYRLFIDQGSVNMVIARKKTSEQEPEKQTSVENSLLSSVGLSNPIGLQNLHSPPHHKSLINQLIISNTNKVRSITLKEPTGLYFKSFMSNDNDQKQYHFVINIQPISMAYRAGLRNSDHILTINDIDATRTSPEDLQTFITKHKPVHLTVIQDSEQLKAFENRSTEQSRKTCTSAIYETLDYQQSKESNNIIFTDEQGPVYIRHCVIKKGPSDEALGFLLNFEDNSHIVRNVEINYPAHQSGLHNGDIILFVNKRSVQQMAHDDLKNLIRTLISSNTAIDLILLNKNDLQRYRTYNSKRFIDWFDIFSKIYKNLSTQTQDHSYVNQSSKPTTDDLSPGSVLSGARICVVEVVPDHSIGFTVEGGCPPPFRICKIEADSPAEKAGLQVNDSLISINGTSVLDKTYDDTLQVIRQATQQAHVQFVVNQLVKNQSSDSAGESDTSLSNSSDEENKTVRQKKSSFQSANAVQLYQKQRAKELSYVVRHCHITATNSDGTPASSFGFELAEDPACQYPIVSHVQSKSPGERCGLQTDDILLKVNDRKTKVTYDVPPERPNSSQVYTPVLSTFAPIPNQMITSYDVIKEPRQCVLQLDPNKGLGFILSSMGDYGHTITAIDKNSIADVAGLQVNDEIVEINGVNVRNVNYEQVIDMLITAMQTQDTIEIHVINVQNLLNENDNTNNNNNSFNSVLSKHVTPVLELDSRDLNIQTDSLKRLTFNTSHPNLQNLSIYSNNSVNYNRSESVPGYSTGITTSPIALHSRPKLICPPNKSNNNVTEIISIKDAPVARLCRIQKFPSSPFYGFFLCGDRKMPGRVFVSNIKKNSSAFICGLRDGDHIIEVNGTNIQNLTYETILNIIKMHMDHQDLELLVLDKKALRWYEKRNYPISSQTLPTIVHIEPIINS